MISSVVILAYFGPETVLPMTSVIATVVGVFMMFGRNTLRFLFRWRRGGAGGATKPAGSAPAPHFVVKEREQSASARR